MDNSLHPLSSVDQTSCRQLHVPHFPSSPQALQQEKCPLSHSPGRSPLELLAPSAVRGSLQYEYLCSVALALAP